MNYSVTLKQLRDGGACYEGYNKVVCALKGTKFTDEIAEKECYIRFAHKDPITLLSILDSNGFEDALWCLRVIPECERDARLFAVWCARQSQHLMTDQRSIDALDVAERFANGNATQEELDAAWAAARAAARDALQGPLQVTLKSKCLSRCLMAKHLGKPKLSRRQHEPPNHPNHPNHPRHSWRIAGPHACTYPQSSA